MEGLEMGIFKSKKKKQEPVIKEEKKIIKSFDELAAYYNLTAEQLKKLPPELIEYFRRVNLSGEQLSQMPTELKRAYFRQRNISIRIENAERRRNEEIYAQMDENLRIETRRKTSKEFIKRVNEKIANGTLTKPKKKSEEDEWVDDGLFRYRKNDEAAKAAVRRKRESWEREERESNGCTMGM